MNLNLYVRSVAGCLPVRLTDWTLYIFCENLFALLRSRNRPIQILGQGGCAA